MNLGYVDSVLQTRFEIGLKGGLDRVVGKGCWKGGWGRVVEGLLAFYTYKNSV